MPDFALGIPRVKNKASLPRVRKPKDWEYVLHDHDAERAGRHIDLRLSDGKKAFSWAVPRGMPDPGEKRLAIRQPDHRTSYMPFEGVIPEGYGKGTVQIAGKGPVRVTHSSDNKLKFVVMNRKDAEEFTMVRTRDDDWLLINHTPTVKKPTKKPKYRSAPKGNVAEFFSHQWGLQPKIDGAHAVTEIGPSGARMFSDRPSERSNRRLQYTWNIPALEKVKSSKKETVVRGELHGVDRNGRVIPSRTLGGILNSTPANARQRLITEGIDLKQALFDVEVHDGENVRSLPYGRRMQILKRIARKNPDVFTIPETATTPREKAKLFQEIAEGRHKVTAEGVIAHNLLDPEQPPVKIKLVDDHDVYVRKILPGKKKGHAGSFEYSHTPKGPIAGTVGTGLSDSLRKSMLKHPEKYVGRAAKVVAQEKFPSGSLRGASFQDWHLDKRAVYQEEETSSFTHDGVKYSLNDVLRMSQGNPVREMSVEELEWILQHQDVDPARVEKADISTPLLVSPSVNSGMATVDGLHRLTQAKQRGVESLPTREAVLDKRAALLVFFDTLAMSRSKTGDPPC